MLAGKDSLTPYQGGRVSPLGDPITPIEDTSASRAVPFRTMLYSVHISHYVILRTYMGILTVDPIVSIKNTRASRAVPFCTTESYMGTLTSFPPTARCRWSPTVGSVASIDATNTCGPFFSPRP